MALGEECDCGDDEVECGDESNLCYPGSIENIDAGKGCKLKEGVECSPSVGPCCNSNGTFVSESVNKTCQMEGECTEESKCNGVSALCPTPPPKDDNTTLCNENTQICRAGECTYSVCEHPDIQQKQCFLKPNMNQKDKRIRQSKMCQIACKNVDGECIPFDQSLVGRSASILLKTTESQLAPGAPCNDGKGYCDVLQRCRDIDADGPITRLKRELFSQETFLSITRWMTEKWYIALIAGIGFVILMAGFIRCFSLHTPSSNPNLPVAHDINATLKRPVRTFRRMVSREDDPYNADMKFARNRAGNRTTQNRIEMTDINERDSFRVMLPKHN